MPAIYKALFVVLAISVAVLLLFRGPFGRQLGQSRYATWTALWLGITVCAFIISNFWIYAAASAALIAFLGRAEPIKPAVYALLLVAVPPYTFPIPGFAGINEFIEINPQLIILFVILLPAMFFSKRMKTSVREGAATDVFVLLWLLLQLGLAVRAPSFTHVLRTGIQEFLAFAPIYYVFSRYPKTLDDFRIVSAAFVLAIVILSVTTFFESAMHWHFYNHIATAWQVDLTHGYKVREGLLRASASTHNPITWGFVAMCGVGIALAVLNDRFPKAYRNISFVALFAGLILSLSRGPWIGAGAVALIFILNSTRAISRFSQLAVASLGVLLVSVVTPFGQRILSLLPFIGESDSGTIDYRQRLLEASWQVALQNPIFGSTDYLSDPKLEAMRQGEGIIDIVNTYVQVMLRSGFVGLLIFVCVFASALSSLQRAMKSARTHNATLALYCQAYFATLAGVALTIFTTSSVEPIPEIYWMLIGGGMALVRIEALERQAPDSQPETHAGASAAPERPAFDWK